MVMSSWGHRAARWAVETGDIRTNGRGFPLQRQFALARDGVTGVMPNGAQLGAPGGYYVDSNQTMDIQRVADVGPQAVLKPLRSTPTHVSARVMATQGGDLAVYSLSNVNNTQDFWESGTRSRAGGQRSSPPCERDVHRRASRAGWTKSDRQGSRGRMAGVRHRYSTLG